MDVSFWDVFSGLTLTLECKARLAFLVDLQHQGKLSKTTMTYDLLQIAQNPLTFYAYLGKHNIHEQKL